MKNSPINTLEKRKALFIVILLISKIELKIDVRKF